MLTYCRHLLKAVMIMTVLMICCFISKADPIKDSIASYINQNYFDTAYYSYKGLEWTWADTIYTSFEKSQEGYAILHRAEMLQSETDSLNAVIADAERQQQPKTYIDSLSKIVEQFEEKQGAIFDEFADKSKAFVPGLYGYKLIHVLQYKNDSRTRKLKMTIVFIFDPTYRIIHSNIEHPFGE